MNITIGRVALLAAALLGLPAFAAEQIKMVERPVGETTVDLGAKGDSIGDLLVFTNGVFDPANKTQIGTDQGYCVRTIVGKSWECIWTLTLKAGQITVEGRYLPTRSQVGSSRFATGHRAQIRPRPDKGVAFAAHDPGPRVIEPETLFGGSGDDRLFGGAGGDMLDGGAGSDSLSGGDPKAYGPGIVWSKKVDVLRIKKANPPLSVESSLPLVCPAPRRCGPGDSAVHRDTA